MRFGWLSPAIHDRIVRSGSSIFHESLVAFIPFAFIAALSLVMTTGYLGLEGSGVVILEPQVSAVKVCTAMMETAGFSLIVRVAAEISGCMLPTMSTIREARKRKGLTPTELAAAIGVSARTLSNFERTNEIPKLATAVRIAKVLDVPLEDLIADEAVA